MKVNGVYQDYFSNNYAVKKYGSIDNASNPAKTDLKHDVEYKPLRNVSYIYFTGIGGITHTPFLKTTADRIDKIYDKYEKDLNEIPLEDIHTISENLQNDLKLSPQEVLNAMGELTQFSGIKSVMKIGEELAENGISSIGNTRNRLLTQSGLKSESKQNKNLQNVLANDNGLHKTLHYLLNEKGIYPTDEIKHNKTAIFLDNTRLSYYEKLKAENPELLKRVLKIPNVQYFMISGWDTGIPFIDRTKDLKTKTKKLLVKAEKEGKTPAETLDENLKNRAQNLGIEKVTVIKNPVEKTENGIYQSMVPLKMTRRELYNIIDANSQVRVNGETNRLIAKDISSKYLEDSLVIYTPEKISKDLKTIHKKITDFAIKNDINQKDILYVLPEETKSYDYITYSYQKINHIPDENIVKSEDLMMDKNLSKDKMLVFLDDCSMSGASISELAVTDISRDTVKNCKNIIFACIDGTRDAKDYFNYIQNDCDKYKLLILHTKDKSKMFDDINHLVTVLQTIGDNGFENGKYGHIFPYMSPDNNCELASNIALLHNVNYRQSEKTYGSVYIRAIKTVSGKMQKVMEIFDKLNNDKTTPRIINQNTDTSHYI